MNKLKFTGGIIWMLEFIYGKNKLDKKLLELNNLPKGTVGFEVSKLILQNNYRLIPKFENHDLKHLVLDYKMTIQDELKMQAYLIGNGNHTIACLLFFSLVILYPSIWRNLFHEFHQGRKSTSIHFLTLENCKNLQLTEIKKIYGRSS